MHAHHMSKPLFSFVTLLLAAFSACSKSDNPAPLETGSNVTPAAATSPTAPIDACALLTSEDIQTVQGEPLQRADASGRSEGELATAQCLFVLASFDKSISLQVVGKGNAKAGRDAKSAWKALFPPEILQERETASGKKKIPPKRIADLGKEAFWMGGPAGGLYVLADKHYIFLSTGGADEEETKIRKCTQLARRALGRL